MFFAAWVVNEIRLANTEKRGEKRGEKRWRFASVLHTNNIPLSQRQNININIILCAYFCWANVVAALAQCSGWLSDGRTAIEQCCWLFWNAGDIATSPPLSLDLSSFPHSTQCSPLDVCVRHYFIKYYKIRNVQKPFTILWLLHYKWTTDATIEKKSMKPSKFHSAICCIRQLRMYVCLCVPRARHERWKRTKMQNGQAKNTQRWPKTKWERTERKKMFANDCESCYLI